MNVSSAHPVKKLSLIDDDSDSDNEGQLLTISRKYVQQQKHSPATVGRGPTDGIIPIPTNDLPFVSPQVNYPRTSGTPLATLYTVRVPQSLSDALPTTMLSSSLSSSSSLRTVPDSTTSTTTHTTGTDNNNTPSSLQQRSKLLAELSSLYQRAAALELILNTSTASPTNFSVPIPNPSSSSTPTDSSIIVEKSSSPSSSIPSTIPTHIIFTPTFSSSTETPLSNPTNNPQFLQTINPSGHNYDKPITDATINLDHTIMLLQNTLNRVRETSSKVVSPTPSIIPPSSSSSLTTTSNTNSIPVNSTNNVKIKPITRVIMDKPTEYYYHPKLSSSTLLSPSSLVTPTKPSSDSFSNSMSTTPATGSSVGTTRSRLKDSIFLSTPAIESKYEWKTLQYSMDTGNETKSGVSPSSGSSSSLATLTINDIPSLSTNLENHLQELNKIVQQLPDDDSNITDKK